MRASTAVNFEPEVDEPVAGGAAADLGEDSLEVGDASVPELDRTEAGAADVADCPAVTP